MSSNFYADIASDLDDTSIMDDDLLELESDFAKSNFEPSSFKQTVSKSESNIFEKNVTKSSKKNFDWLNDSDDRPVTAEPPLQIQSKPISKKTSVRFTSGTFDNDILDNMGLDDVKSKTAANVPEKSKKESILSELFGKSESKTIINKPVIQEKSLPTTESNANTSAPPVRKRSERKNSGMLDPLGLFSSPKKTPVEPQVDNLNSLESVTKEKPLSDNLPDWLGGAQSKAASQGANKPLSTAQSRGESAEEEKLQSVKNTTFKKEQSVEERALPSAGGRENVVQSSPPMEANPLSVLHQQETHLLLAVQLKKFEERLINIESQQKSTIVQQADKLQAILSEQNNYQKIIEEQIVKQQERINEHLQMLMIAPRLATRGELEGDFRCQTKPLDNARVEKVKELYPEEYFIVENSYKKQVALLEESLAANEALLKAEIIKISDYYQKKVEQLETQIEEVEHKYTEKIKGLNENYKTEIENISKHYQHTINILNNEHSEAIEHVRRSKILENNVIIDNQSFAATLKDALEQFENKSKDIVEIQQHLRNQFDLQISIKGAEIKSKENELKLLLKQTERQNEILESDRHKLMNLVESLEIRLSEQNVARKEIQWECQNRETRLAARESALERETQRMKDLAERERIQIENMKQDALAEIEKLNVQIVEAKLALAAEKSRLETEGKLRKDYDVLKGRAEVDAAIAAAQKAASFAEQERERLAEERQKMELERKQFEAMERNFHNREAELNSMFQICERKKEEAAQMLNESKLLELKYNEQHKSLQNQLASLRIREKKLAEDKVNLSKERIALHKGEFCSSCLSSVNVELKERTISELIPPPSFIRTDNIQLNKIRYSEDVEK